VLAEDSRAILWQPAPVTAVPKPKRRGRCRRGVAKPRLATSYDCDAVTLSTTQRLSGRSKPCRISFRPQLAPSTLVDICDLNEQNAERDLTCGLGNGFKEFVRDRGALDAIRIISKMM